MGRETWENYLGRRVMWFVSIMCLNCKQQTPLCDRLKQNSNSLKEVRQLENLPKSQKAEIRRHKARNCIPVQGTGHQKVHPTPQEGPEASMTLLNKLQFCLSCIFPSKPYSQLRGSVWRNQRQLAVPSSRGDWRTP